MIERLALAAVIIALPGCGLSDYESRMTATLKELQEKTRYESLYGPTAIDALVGEDAEPVALPITIRLPKAFKQDDWFRPGSEYRNRRETVDPRVSYPPFLGEFPGLNRTGETYAEAGDRYFLAYYCYLGVLESRAAKFEAVLADLRKKTAAKLKDTGPWQEVECRDDRLQPTTWRTFEAKGTQTFADRSDRFTEMPGTFRVFAREDRGYIVVWAVRVPDAVAEKTSLLAIADAVAGTVKVTAAAPDGGGQGSGVGGRGSASPTNADAPAGAADKPAGDGSIAPADKSDENVPAGEGSPADEPAVTDPQA